MFCEDQTSYDQTALESISVWNPLPQAQLSKRVNHTPKDSKRIYYVTESLALLSYSITSGIPVTLTRVKC